MQDYNNCGQVRASGYLPDAETSSDGKSLSTSESKQQSALENRVSQFHNPDVDVKIIDSSDNTTHSRLNTTVSDKSSIFKEHNKHYESTSSCNTEEENTLLRFTPEIINDRERSQKVSNSSLSSMDNSDSSNNFKLIEEPNIHSNLLANVELTNNYIQKMTVNSSKASKSQNEGPSTARRNFHTSYETPCIADVNGRTSFKVKSAGNIEDKVPTKSRSSSLTSSKLTNSFSSTFKNVSNIVMADTVTSTNNYNYKPSLVRSKSLSGQTDNKDVSYSKAPTSPQHKNSIARNNSSPEISKSRDEGYIGSFISRNLFPWKSKPIAKSLSIEDTSPTHQSSQPLIENKDVSARISKEENLSTEISTNGSSLNCNAVPRNSTPCTNKEVKTSNNNTTLTNYNGNVVDKFVHRENLNSFSSQCVTKSAITPTTNPSTTGASSSSTTTPSSSSGWWFFSRGLQKKNKSSLDSASSVGLIMESRPGNLPAKTPEEALQHQLQHQMLIENNKKKELQLIESNKLKLRVKLKEEAETAIAVQVWTEELIPNFEIRKDVKRCRELWWKGIPSCVRGKVWQLAVGNPLNVSPHLYEMLKQRSEEDENAINDDKCSNTSSDGSNSDSSKKTKSAWANSWQEVYDSSHHISLDVSRTFPHLCIFQEGGPLHLPLHGVLNSYVRCRPDVGYVQGMSFLAATILLNMTESETFILFANILNKPILQAFYSLHQKKMVAYYRTFTVLLTNLCPALCVHLRRIEVSPDLYLLDWLLSLYTRCLPLDIASRIWDLYFRDGDEFLFRTAFGILKLYEKELLSLECTTTAAQFLTRLPSNIDQHQLFHAIAKISMPSGKKGFAELLARHEQEARETSCV